MRKKQTQFMLRMDPERHMWIKARAAKNRRTLNSEINILLDQRYEKDLREGKVVEE